VDIGLNDAPPSPDEVDAGMADMRDADADSLAGISSDAEDLGRPEAPTDTGNDVFGLRPARDEDVSIPPLGFPAAEPRFSSNPADELAAMPTPVPWAVSPSPPAAPASIPNAEKGEAQALEGMSLEAALADPTVTSIVIATGGAMLIERAGKSEVVPAAGDSNAIAETVWQIANTAVPPPPSDNPVVDVRLLDGTRVTALFPPVTAGSVCAAIRKVATPQIPLVNIAGGADVESILRAAVMSRRNLLLAGDRPAVATLLASLAEVIPDGRRVMSIGVGGKARSGWIELGPGLDPAALARAAVAFRADHMLFADSGGAELPELLLGAARGQEGVIACMTARSVTEALGRLRGFAVGSLGAAGFSALLTGTIDLIVLASSSAGDGVQIVEMAEPQTEGETVVPSFVARPPEGSRAPVALNVAGVSARLAAAIAASAAALPDHLVRH
jgi:pilus assembly protein CpaF